jgi:hypothetical protein
MFLTHPYNLQNYPIHRLPLKPVFGLQVPIENGQHLLDGYLSFHHDVLDHLADGHPHTCDLVSEILTEFLEQDLGLLFFVGSQFDVLHDGEFLSPALRAHYLLDDAHMH